VTHEPEQVVARAGALLGQAGVPYSAINPVEPTLEDVFISVLAQNRGEPAAYESAQ
jgi:hypothetical protein